MFWQSLLPQQIPICSKVSRWWVSSYFPLSFIYFLIGLEFCSHHTVDSLWFIIILFLFCLKSRQSFHLNWSVCACVFTCYHAERSSQDSRGREIFYAWTALVREISSICTTQVPAVLLPSSFLNFLHSVFVMAECLFGFGGEDRGYREAFMKDNT